MKTVAVVAMNGVQLLDVAGPLDVFAEANTQAQSQIYQLHIVTTGQATIRSSSGIKLLADSSIIRAPKIIDTLLIAGAPDAENAIPNKTVLSWLNEAIPGTRRFGSVCSGAFLLADTGLIDGRRITTHWALADLLEHRYPKIKVLKDEIYVRDGPVRTAAGVTAGLDLALRLVEEDLGREVAIRVAKQLVMFFRRPGGQMAFSLRSEILPAGRSVLQEVQRYISANLTADLSVGKLSERVGISARHFSRIFHQEVGCTPAEWVISARVNNARLLFDEGNNSAKQVARLSGFTDVTTMRRAFRRLVGVTPAEYAKSYVGKSR